MTTNDGLAVRREPFWAPHDTTRGVGTESTWRRPAPDDHQFELLAARLTDRRPRRYERFVKPVFDRVIAVLLLAILSSAMLLISVAVWLSVGRPVILSQTRVGLGGSPFSMFKFRTMRPDRRVCTKAYDGAERRVTHKCAEDPRHTRMGRWLRKLSLDELPQLLNVVRGDMSLVGPRPEMAVLAAGYLGWQQARHIVRPGVTGLWQTTERGQGRLLHECVDVDLRYIEHLSFSNDIAILLRTPLTLVRNRGVI